MTQIDRSRDVALEAGRGNSSHPGEVALEVPRATCIRWPWPLREAPREVSGTSWCSRGCPLGILYEFHLSLQS